MGRQYLERSTGKRAWVTDKPWQDWAFALMFAFAVPGLLSSLVGGVDGSVPLFLLVAVGAIWAVCAFVYSRRDRHSLISGTSKGVMTKYEFHCTACGYNWESQR